MLTPDEIRTVQADWQKVVPIAPTAATMFYERLFELDPSLRRLFPADLTEQKKKLVAMIGVAVNGLTNLAAIVPAVQDLGRRHVGYGVQPAHYATVGAALLWTLKAGLGDGFDASHEAAWAKVYGVLADTMQSAGTGTLMAV
jgi:hemoglobin-like flavoprotein